MVSDRELTRWKFGAMAFMVLVVAMFGAMALDTWARTARYEAVERRAEACTRCIEQSAGIGACCVVCGVCERCEGLE